MEELLNKIKTSLRISHTALDDDVMDTIDACLADLRAVGVLADMTNADKGLDPLVLNAVKLYCKAAYTDDPVKAANYQRGYDSLKATLKIAEGYGYQEAGTDE